MGEEALATPAEGLTLWQRMSVFDARSLLGYYCYRANAYDDAQRIWGRLPKLNLEKRPEIAALYVAVRHEMALRTDGELDALLPPPTNHAGAPDGDPSNSAPVPAMLQDQGDADPNMDWNASAGRPPVTDSVPLWSAGAYSDWASSVSGAIPVPAPEVVESVAVLPGASSPQIATIEPALTQAEDDDGGDTLPGKALPRA